MSPSTFNSLIIAVSGSHKGYTQAKLERMVVANGGKFSKVIDDQVTHLVTTPVDFEKPSVKVKIAQDISSLEIVSLEWFLESIEKKKKCREADFLIGAATSAAAPAPQAAPQVAPAPAPQTPSKPDAEELPKKRKSRSATVAADGDKAKSDDQDQKPAAKKAKPDAKGKGKAKQEPAKDDTKDEDEKDDNKKEEPKMKTVVKKGKAPVDEFCPIARTAHVYVDPAGCVYDATLNQANIGNNNNKFYYCQLLESDSSKSYSVFAHWGRVGDRGQTKMYLQNASLDAAKSQFGKLFKGKTGEHWENREAAKGGPGKYTYLERNYEEDDEEDEEMPNAPTIKKAQSKLSQALQRLISLIFDTNIMQQSMKSMSYDSAKLPLGKLSKKTILEGYQVLKDLGQVIEEDGDYLNDFRHLGQSKSAILTELSNRYYSIIPHVFPGRGRPTVIDDDAHLKAEIDLVENLTDMVITTKILKETKSAEDDIHPLDKQFEGLGLNEAEPLDPSSTEYKNLEAYLLKSRGHTHYMKLTVQDIFRIRRSVEEERWQKDGWDKIPNSSRRLLWHGSRSTNFAGILSQGLRIAPPEAPVNGYMFDKASGRGSLGIYLADVVTKSANYCCAHNSGGTGLLLLCEAQLGDPMYECRGPDYHAATKCKQAGHLATKGLGRTAPLKWEDASVVSEELKGVQMPKVSGSESNITGNAKTSGQLALEYNEYIVYNVSQVKIRYLFKCSFT